MQTSSQALDFNYEPAAISKCLKLTVAPTLSGVEGQHEKCEKAAISGEESSINYFSAKPKLMNRDLFLQPIQEQPLSFKRNGELDQIWRPLMPDRDDSGECFGASIRKGLLSYQEDRVSSNFSIPITFKYL